ncbi:LLM class flavin-dependent oxidoreductase [Leucobacter sp. M11]|uniref:LLM class flavin-dependent oxidoreductase n=1 Tax=Leucobacter sp. M11 TaxID=2993565 RepID=UPI003FA5C7B0
MSGIDAAVRTLSLSVKRIGFLSFGHWQDIPGSRVRTAGDSLSQSLDLAVAAEEVGVDGAFFRVHHFAQQLAAPFPLLSAIGARTSRIELGTGVLDLRYENPLDLAENAAATDLLSGGRLHLGVSRGSPETVVDGATRFGYPATAEHPQGGDTRAKAAEFLAAIAGEGLATPNPRTAPPGTLQRIEPHAPGLGERIWWGASTRDTAEWAASLGMNLMSSTLMLEDTGVPYDELQAEQIARFRAAWAAAGHGWEPRVAVTRSVIPLTEDEDREYFGLSGTREAKDQVGRLEGRNARSGRSYIGEPDVIAAELSRDAAVQAADTLLVTVPNMLGVDYNVRLLDTIVREIKPALGSVYGGRPGS